MLGERSDQRGLWEADRLYLDHVGKDTFYGLLASLGALTMYGEGLAHCRVNLTYWPAAWTSSSSRSLDAQSNPAGSVSVTAPKPPAPPSKPAGPPLRYCALGAPRISRRGRGL